MEETQTSAGSDESDRPSFSVSPPQISLPKGGGAIRGIGEKFGVSPATGTGSLTIPIATSPGRSGFGPKLSLSYDSGAGNGPFGFGWQISIPSITRKTDKGLPRYNDFNESDVFILSGAEDLVPILDKSLKRCWKTRTLNRVLYKVFQYRPRIEGIFARIERWTSDAGITHWRSITRDNVTTLYGLDENSQISDRSGDPQVPIRVFSYLISRTFDEKGNIAVYSYKRETSDMVDKTHAREAKAHEANRTDADRGRQRYLKSIRYGNVQPYFPDWSEKNNEAKLPTAWHFEVVFDYSDHSWRVPVSTPNLTWKPRPDPFSSYRSGFEVRTYRRCRRILAFHHFPDQPNIGNECLVHSTDLQYSDQNTPSNPSGPIYTFLTSVKHTSYRRKGTRYESKSMPSVDFEYSVPRVQSEVLTLDDESAKNLPEGIDGTRFRWVDLDGEGATGVLSIWNGNWTYRRNLSPAYRVARFAPLETIPTLPSASALLSERLMDLSGDGQLDVVTLQEPHAGFFERTEKKGWASWRRFQSLPQVNWSEPNLKFVDLTGDGLADALITDDGVFTFYRSRGERGFAAAERVFIPRQEKYGPKVVLADGTETMFLADMTGDGLADLVRVRNGEVCYWPNLGYGLFGRKVTMDNAPRFVEDGQFDPKRIRLADIDGSGTNDLFYVDGDGVRVWFNQSGNSWANHQRIALFPTADDLSSVQLLDLLGNGTACLVWSSPLMAESETPLRYIDLMGGNKPHLMVRVRNNLGAETHIRYAASTYFYVKDKLSGRPWVTRLPHIVHVVHRTETFDFVGRSRFVSRYAYHHGYFDGIEREFRGFGMVEQWDTELHSNDSDFPKAQGSNWDTASWSPPTLTRSWFHTGAFEAGGVSRHFEHEYWVEPALRDDPTLIAQERRKRAAARAAMLLPDTVIEDIDRLSPEELREAYRALKGSALRIEVYAEDETLAAEHPYTVTEQNFAVSCVQARGPNRHAVFLTHPRESISYHYERNPDDPRIAHSMTLDVDAYGNVRRAMSIGYGRRPNQSTLKGTDKQKQEDLLITYNENDVTNAIDDLALCPDDHRTPLPCETRTYELTGLAPSGTATRFSFDDFAVNEFVVLDGLHEIQYENVADPTVKEKRLIEHSRTLYRNKDFTGLLTLGVVDTMALPGESYKKAITSGLAKKIFVDSGKSSQADLNVALADAGKYVHSMGDAHWWLPSGRTFYSPDRNNTAAEELAYAKEHFFLPLRNRDPFHTNAVPTETLVSYDSYNLLVLETSDALGNRITAGTRNPDGTTTPSIDYRVLQPQLLMDPNRNCSQVAFDLFGLVVATAVMGKPEDNPAKGDLIDRSLETDLRQDELDLFYGDPKGQAGALLGKATTRVVYDLDRFHHSRTASPNDSSKWEAAYAATIAHEIHFADKPDPNPKVQISFSYSDGLGREIQKKIQAEVGKVPTRDGQGRIIVGADGQPVMSAAAAASRWVGSGWTVSNNKGKPVRQYEPFFSDTHKPDFDTRIGVTPILFYDPAGRVIATLHANHTYEKVLFDPWQQTTFDVNDAVASDPRMDSDIKGYVKNYFASQPPTWRTWLQQRIANPQHPPADTQGQILEQDAAVRALAHADTPSEAHFDTLGRTFLTIADNGLDPATPNAHVLYSTRTPLDIEGNQREVIDAKGRVVMRYDHDMLGNRLHQASMEAGERWMLNDVASKPIRAWDSRGHAFKTEYDQLRRALRLYVRGRDPVYSDLRTLNRDVLFEKIEYGEGQPNDVQLNLRTRIFKSYDGAGTLTNDEFDFKGNPLSGSRQIADDYKGLLNWSGAVNLADTFTSSTTYDALNRVVTLTTEDGSVVRPSYNEANLLESVDVNIRGAKARTAFVTNIDYDAKGQRTHIDYGTTDEMGISTTYAYDLQTFRLIHLETTRNAAGFDATDRAGEVQNLSYSYDPAGNITYIQDNAQDTIYFKNQKVQPSNDYVYDAIYRLIQASGREHLGQNGAPVPHSYNDAQRVGLLSANAGKFAPNDGKAMGCYRETYQYDEVGNFITMSHTRTDGSGGWTRSYTYNEDSQLEIGKESNRLTSTNFGDGTYEIYSRMRDGYDPHGNILHMPQLQVMQWDFKDRLLMTQRQKVNDADNDGKVHQGEKTYYVYDSGGQRVRKVTERQAAAGVAPTRMKERIYVTNYEIYREYKNDGRTVSLERETLHVMDDKKRIALVETRTVDRSVRRFALVTLIRYQFGNHLGSVSLELNGDAQIISYEEYTPYGNTAYQAVRSQTEAAKRYRYTGMERDEESGLYYHWARYYAAWLGRWLACDPGGLVDGANLYTYASDNAIRFSDPTGRASDPKRSYAQADFKPEVITTKRHEPTNGKREPTNPIGALGKAPTLAAETTEAITSNIYNASQASNPHYYKTIKDAPAHIKTFQESGVIKPIGVKTPIVGGNAEALMTVRQLQGPDTIVELGTDRSSWTKKVEGALLRGDGDRKAVVRVDPDEVNAKNGRFKKIDELLSDTSKAESLARNSKERSQAKYATKNAIKYTEGHAVEATPEGTVRPIGVFEGRGDAAARMGRGVGTFIGVSGTLALSALSGTPAYRAPDGQMDVQYTGVPVDPHIDDGLGSEINWELGGGPKPHHMEVDPNRSFMELVPLLLFALLL
jgi:RHS repeat-associated protein